MKNMLVSSVDSHKHLNDKDIQELLKKFKKLLKKLKDKNLKKWDLFNRRYEFILVRLKDRQESKNLLITDMDLCIRLMESIIKK